MDPIVQNAADESQVKNAGTKEKRQREKDLDDVRNVLTTLPGRRLLWRYLSECGVFRTSWHPSALIHFNEGKRDMGLKILADITDADENFLLQMMKENKEKK